MSKELITYNRFKGGLNTEDDPRDIERDELAAADNVVIRGNLIESAGDLSDYTGTVPSPPDAVGITGGYGLFQFSTDRVVAGRKDQCTAGAGLNTLEDTGATFDADGYAAGMIVVNITQKLHSTIVTVVDDNHITTAAGDAITWAENDRYAILGLCDDTGQDWLALYDDSGTDQRVWLWPMDWDAANDDWIDVGLDCGTVHDGPNFYYVDGGLRISSGKLSLAATTVNQVFKYIDASRFSDNLVIDRWYVGDPKIATPTAGSILTTSAPAKEVIGGHDEYNNNTFTVTAATKRIDDSASGLDFFEVGDSFDIRDSAGGNNGTYTVATVDAAFAYITTDEALSDEGPAATLTLDNNTRLREDATTNWSADEWIDYYLWKDDDDETKIITDNTDSTIEATFSTKWTDGDNWRLYPPAGGVLFSLSFATAGGGWSASEYEFGYTYIYDGKQESLIKTMTGTQTPAGSDRYAEVTHLNVTEPDDPRISAYRIYTRIKDTGDEWLFFLEVDFVDGVRSWDRDGWITWNSSQTNSAPPGYDLTTGTSLASIPVPTNTYEMVSGIPQDSQSLDARWKSACVGNGRAWAGHVRMKNPQGVVENFGDRLLYTPALVPVGQWDTWPTDNFLDILTRDGDNIVKVAFYSDRLLVFKKRLMVIVDVSDPEPGNWFMEDPFHHKGVQHPAAVLETEYGVVWASDTGVWLFDGEKVSSVLPQSKLRTEWDSFYNANSILNYDPLMKRLIVTSGIVATDKDISCMFCNMTTGAWTTAELTISGSSDDEEFTNFVALPSGITMLCVNDTEEVRKYSDAPVVDVTRTRTIEFRDDVLAGPGKLNDMVYGVVLTYESAAAVANGLKYRTNKAAAWTNLGSLVDTNDAWAVALFTPSDPIECASIQLQIAATCDIKVLDVSLIVRTDKAITERTP